MGDDKERFTRSNCKSNSELPLKLRVSLELSKEFWVQAGVQHISVFCCCFLQLRIIKYASEGLMNEIFYADDLVLIYKSMGDLR